MYILSSNGINILYSSQKGQVQNFWISLQNMQEYEDNKNTYIYKQSVKCLHTHTQTRDYLIFSIYKRLTVQ